MGGRYVPSLLAAIGEVIERHMIDIGFLQTGRPGSDPYAAGPLLAAVGETPRAQISAMPETPDQARAASPPLSYARQCPKCGSPSLIRQEGCDTCTSCDYSKCA
jgi:ribonucleoside-diphosphate reductase alpha chain